jgi:tetrathionate reductase subunit B
MSTGGAAMSKTKKWGMVIDLTRCTGCGTCSVACKAENDVPPGVFRSWVKILEKGVYPDAKNYTLPVLCNNCENAVCVRVCPATASYKREDGIVMIDPHKCVGCKYCMAACPYQVRHINPLRRYAQKCFFCSHRIDAGLQPACVEACPSGARVFGDLNDPDSEISKILVKNAVSVLKPEAGTKPNVFYIGLDKDIADPLSGVDIKRFQEHDIKSLEDIFG